MIPTHRLVALAAVPLLIGTVAYAVPMLVWPMVVVNLLIIVVALFDARGARAEVTVARTVDPVQAVGRAFHVQLNIEVDRDITLRITDDGPGEAAGIPATLRVRPGQVTVVPYWLTCPSRGDQRFGPIQVRWSTPLGLFEREVRFEPETELRVYPRFDQLRSAAMAGLSDERRAASKVLRRPGGENEFERLRPYVRGDAYRHIDWRATARKRHLVTREFGQEVNQNVIFLLDAGRMMSATHQGITAFDQALDAAMTMAQVALRHGDRVGLLVYDDQIRAWSPPQGGSRTGTKLIRATYDVFPSLREPDHVAALRWLSGRVRRRSLVVMLTTVIDDVNAQVSHEIVSAMTRRHLPLVAWLRDSGLEEMARGQGGANLFSGGAAAELLQRRDRQLLALKRRGALVLDVEPGALTPGLVSEYLQVKARKLL